MRNRSADAAAIALMRRQHDVARVSQLLELGLSRDQVALRVQRGVFDRIARGVVGLAGRRNTLHTRAMRGVMIAGDSAVACRWTAAALHQLKAPTPSTVHVLIQTPRRVRSIDDVVIHRTRTLPPDHVVRVASIPTTSIPRTITDCATELDAWAALAMLDSSNPTPGLWRAIHATADEMSNGRAGVRAIALATHPDGAQRLRSVLERKAAAALRARGISHGEWNVTLSDARGVVREVDLYFRSAGVVVEVDGLRFHAPPGQARRDRATDRRLQQLGLRVLRFVWLDVVSDPSGFAGEIADALGI